MKFFFFEKLSSTLILTLVASSTRAQLSSRFHVQRRDDLDHIQQPGGLDLSYDEPWLQDQEMDESNQIIRRGSCPNCLRLHALNPNRIVYVTENNRGLCNPCYNAGCPRCLEKNANEMPNPITKDEASLCNACSKEVEIDAWKNGAELYGCSNCLHEAREKLRPWEGIHKAIPVSTGEVKYCGGCTVKLGLLGTIEAPQITVYQCSICKMAYSDEGYLEIHIDTQHKSHFWKSRNVQPVRVTAKVEERFTCTDCYRLYSRDSTAVGHSKEFPTHKTAPRKVVLMDGIVVVNRKGSAERDRSRIPCPFCTLLILVGSFNAHFDQHHK